MVTWLDRRRVRGSAGLNVLLAVSGLVAAAALVVAVAAIAGSLGGERSVAVRVLADEVDITIDDVDLTIEEVSGTVEASGGIHLVGSLGAALEALAAGVIAVVLGLVVWSARRGEPFESANATRLRIAAGAAVVGFVGGLVQSVGHLLATDDAGLTPSTEIGFGWPAAILVFVVLSQVWAVGVGLRDDAELTI